MSITLNPYLNFQTTSREVMMYYHSIFGGDINLSTFGDSHMGSEAEKDLIVHATLTTPYFTLMASDASEHHTVHEGDNVNLSLMGDDETLLTEYFNKLADGGHIDMPLEKQFWGDSFGMITDKYGIHWMVNISSVK